MFSGDNCYIRCDWCTIYAAAFPSTSPYPAFSQKNCTAKTWDCSVCHKTSHVRDDCPSRFFHGYVLRKLESIDEITTRRKQTAVCTVFKSTSSDKTQNSGRGKCHLKDFHICLSIWATNKQNVSSLETPGFQNHAARESLLRNKKVTR